MSDTKSRYPLTEANAPGHRFAFRPRGGRLNWRHLEALSIEDIIKHGDVRQLEAFLENMCFARFDPDRDDDKDLGKLIQVMQLGMEFCYSSAREQAERTRHVEDVSQAKSHEIYDLTTRLKKAQKDMKDKRRQCSIYENLLRTGSVSARIGKENLPPSNADNSGGKQAHAVHALAGLGVRSFQASTPLAVDNVVDNITKSGTDVGFGVSTERRSQFVRADVQDGSFSTSNDAGGTKSSSAERKARSSSFPRFRKEDVDYFYPCDVCGKRFGSSEFLMRHALRRHPAQASRDPSYYKTMHPSMRHKSTGEIFPGGANILLCSPANMSPRSASPELHPGTRSGSKSCATAMATDSPLELVPTGNVCASQDFLSSPFVSGTNKNNTENIDDTTSVPAPASEATESGAVTCENTYTEKYLQAKIAEIREQLKHEAEERVAAQVAAVLRKLVASSSDESVPPSISLQSSLRGVRAQVTRTVHSSVGGGDEQGVIELNPDLLQGVTRERRPTGDVVGTMMDPSVGGLQRIARHKSDDNDTPESNAEEQLRLSHGEEANLLATRFRRKLAAKVDGILDERLQLAVQEALAENKDDANHRQQFQGENAALQRTVQDLYKGLEQARTENRNLAVNLVEVSRKNEQLLAPTKVDLGPPIGTSLQPHHVIHEQREMLFDGPDSRTVSELMTSPGIRTDCILEEQTHESDSPVLRARAADPTTLWGRISAVRSSAQAFSSMLLSHPSILSKGLSEGLLVAQQDSDGSVVVVPKPNLDVEQERTLLEICPDLQASVMRADTEAEAGAERSRGAGCTEDFSTIQNIELSGTRISPISLRDITQTNKRSARRRSDESLAFLSNEGLGSNGNASPTCGDFYPSQYVQARPRISVYSSYEPDPKSPMPALRRGRDRTRRSGWIKTPGAHVPAVGLAGDKQTRSRIRASRSPGRHELDSLVFSDNTALSARALGAKDVQTTLEDFSNLETTQLTSIPHVEESRGLPFEPRRSVGLEGGLSNLDSRHSLETAPGAVVETNERARTAYDNAGSFFAQQAGKQVGTAVGVYSQDVLLNASLQGSQTTVLIPNNGVPDMSLSRKASSVATQLGNQGFGSCSETERVSAGGVFRSSSSMEGVVLALDKDLLQFQRAGPEALPDHSLSASATVTLVNQSQVDNTRLGETQVLGVFPRADIPATARTFTGDSFRPCPPSDAMMVIGQESLSLPPEMVDANVIVASVGNDKPDQASLEIQDCAGQTAPGPAVRPISSEGLLTETSDCPIIVPVVSETITLDQTRMEALAERRSFGVGVHDDISNSRALQCEDLETTKIADNVFQPLVEGTSFGGPLRESMASMSKWGDVSSIQHASLHELPQLDVTKLDIHGSPANPNTFCPDLPIEALVKNQTKERSATVFDSPSCSSKTAFVQIEEFSRIQYVQADGGSIVDVSVCTDGASGLLRSVNRGVSKRVTALTVSLTDCILTDQDGEAVALPDAEHARTEVLKGLAGMAAQAGVRMIGGGFDVQPQESGEEEIDAIFPMRTNHPLSSSAVIDVPPPEVGSLLLQDKSTAVATRDEASEGAPNDGNNYSASSEDVLAVHVEDGKDVERIGYGLVVVPKYESDYEDDSFEEMPCRDVAAPTMLPTASASLLPVILSKTSPASSCQVTSHPQLGLSPPEPVRHPVVEAGREDAPPSPTVSRSPRLAVPQHAISGRNGVPPAIVDELIDDGFSVRENLEVMPADMRGSSAGYPSDAARIPPSASTSAIPKANLLTTPTIPPAGVPEEKPEDQTHVDDRGTLLDGTRLSSYSGSIPLDVTNLNNTQQVATNLSSDTQIELLSAEALIDRPHPVARIEERAFADSVSPPVVLQDSAIANDATITARPQAPHQTQLSTSSEDETTAGRTLSTRAGAVIRGIVDPVDAHQEERNRQNKWTSSSSGDEFTISAPKRLSSQTERMPFRTEENKLTTSSSDEDVEARRLQNEELQCGQKEVHAFAARNVLSDSDSDSVSAATGYRIIEAAKKKGQEATVKAKEVLITAATENEIVDNNPDGVDFLNSFDLSGDSSPQASPPDREDRLSARQESSAVLPAVVDRDPAQTVADRLSAALDGMSDIDDDDDLADILI